MWLYKGEEFTEDLIGNSFGYVYLITNLLNGRKYLGKKLFTKASRKQTKGKIKKIRVSSDWKNYWSSSDTLKEDVKNLGESNFSREILHLCKTRSECNYFELREQIDRRVLESNVYYNGWVSAKISKKNLKLCF